MDTSFKKLISSVIAFATGVTAGILIAPKNGKDNRKWVLDHAGEARSWMGAKGQKLLDRSEERLKKISEGVKGAIPDLFEATAEMHFDEEHQEQDE